jgi:hypothetical protein
VITKKTKKTKQGRNSFEVGPILAKNEIDPPPESSIATSDEQLRTVRQAINRCRYGFLSLTCRHFRLPQAREADTSLERERSCRSHLLQR